MGGEVIRVVVLPTRERDRWSGEGNHFLLHINFSLPILHRKLFGVLLACVPAFDVLTAAARG